MIGVGHLSLVQMTVRIQGFGFDGRYLKKKSHTRYVKGGDYKHLTPERSKCIPLVTPLRDGLMLKTRWNFVRIVNSST